MKILRGYTAKGCFSEWQNDDGVPVCYAVEKPWVDNAPYVSCVPEGTYGLVEYNSPKFGDTYALVNHDCGVGLYEGDSDRFACLIHKGNWPHNVQGCIAPVSSLTVLGGKWGGANSTGAYNIVIEMIESGDTQLIITHEEALYDGSD
jgi:hypothetical protein